MKTLQFPFYSDIVVMAAINVSHIEIPELKNR